MRWEKGNIHGQQCHWGWPGVVVGPTVATQTNACFIRCVGLVVDRISFLSIPTGSAIFPCQPTSMLLSIRLAHLHDSQNTLHPKGSTNGLYPFIGFLTDVFTTRKHTHLLFIHTTHTERMHVYTHWVYRSTQWNEQTVVDMGTTTQVIAHNQYFSMVYRGGTHNPGCSGVVNHHHHETRMEIPCTSMKGVLGIESLCSAVGSPLPVTRKSNNKNAFVAEKVFNCILPVQGLLGGFTHVTPRLHVGVPTQVEPCNYINTHMPSHPPNPFSASQRVVPLASCNTTL